MSKENIEKFDEDFVNILLKSNESNSLEFKQKVSSKEKIAKSISSLANKNGGLLIIGISDQKRIIGIDTDEEIYMIESAIQEYCLPHPKISIEKIKWNDPDPSPYENEEKHILKVEIQKSETPIKAKDKNGNWHTYQREGDHTITLV